MKKYLLIIILVVIIISSLIIVLVMNKKDKEKIVNIKSIDFFYSTSTMMNGDVHYEIKCEDKCIMKYKPQLFSMEQAKEYILSSDDLVKIEELFNKYEVIKWDGFNKSDPYVLDGNSFHLYVKYNLDKGIDASGYMMYPNNYREVKKELEDILLKYVSEGDFKNE